MDYSDFEDKKKKKILFHLQTKEKWLLAKIEHYLWSKFYVICIYGTSFFDI